LQALWTARRAQGERVTADEVAQPWVHTSGATSEPNAQHVELYRAAAQRFRALVPFSSTQP
jgi:hypothetical protein